MVKVVGNGVQCVYVYYFAQYQKDHDDYYWPCKVGMSTRSALTRIKEQTKTAMPEPPIIGLIIHTDQAQLLERLIHTYLQYQKRQIKLAGTEWYQTTPDEVLTICQTLRIV